MTVGKRERRERNSLVGCLVRVEGCGEVCEVVIPWTFSCVVESKRRLCPISTVRPKCCRKSAPRIGCFTSATMKDQRKVQRRPKLKVRERVPYVVILLPLAAIRLKLSCG